MLLLLKGNFTAYSKNIVYRKFRSQNMAVSSGNSKMTT